MTLAKECGINVPEMRLVQVGRQDVFLIKRFDREKTGSGWCRNGFQSSLSLMQWDEREHHNWSYPAIAGRLRRFMATPHIHEFFLRMVFNILVRNTDDHPRNHGILFQREQATLSPAYDILPALTRPGVGTDFRLAMSIGDQGREALLENTLSQSEQFGLAKKAAIEMINELLHTLARWPDHFTECGFRAKDIELFRPSFMEAKMDGINQ